MNTTQKYQPFFGSVLLMCVVLFFIYPHYQYYIDPDGTAYLTISQRYANGDFTKAINGLWSPWACWLTALLIKTGMAAIPASWLVNALGAVGFLFISQSFFLKFDIIPKLQWVFCATLSLFLCFAIFWQSFDDLWGCFFLLCTLRIMLAERFKTTLLLWVTCGVVGALAYFAKAYSFPFFILNTACCTYFISKDNKMQWLKISFTAIGTMVLCSLPWIYALHYKYGIWLTSTAGPLNLAWFLVGHPYYKEGIDLLLPPIYKDSLSFWEDPWFVNGKLPHFWDSMFLAKREVLRIGYNVYKLLLCSLQLSVLFPVIGFVGVRSSLQKKERTAETPAVRILIISCLLLPLGYLMASLESRYLWYMLPLGMVVGGLFLQRRMSSSTDLLFIKIAPYLLAITFLVYPVWHMLMIFEEGEFQYTMAQQLKKINVQGTFTSMAKPGLESQAIQRLAYFSGNQLYNVSKPVYTQQDVLREMRRYHIKYFFAYGRYGNFRDEQGKTFPEITHGQIDWLKIFLVNQ